MRTNLFLLISYFSAGFPVDTIEEKTGFIVKADLPGVTKDKLKLNYQDSWLAIESERPCDGENLRSAFVERPCGISQRHIRLPVAIKPESITAKLEDGVLTVHMQKEKPGDAVNVRIN